MVRALLALLLAGCIPGRHPVVGTACDAEHPCPDGLGCVAAVCSEGGAGGAGGGGTGGGVGGGAGGAGGTGGGVATGCSGQLLSDGDFEEGVFFQAYWLGMPGSALSVQGATVHGGAYAAKIAPASAGAVALRTQLTAVGAQQGSDHCVDAWVRSSDATAPVTLQLARWLTGPDYSGAAGDAVAVADGGWQRLSNRFAYPSGQVGLTVQVDTSLPAGGALFVDDVCVRVCP